jgi:dihydrofolate synthase/folylpolyglutamate synthase
VEAPLLALGRDFHGAGSAEAWSGRFAAGEIGPVRLALPGSYQVENAATAAAVALHLLGDGILAGGALRRGLEEARWPGRFDLRTVEGTELLLDGAHNPHAMEAFIRAFRERWDHRPAVLFALKEDKDADAMCALLADLADSLVITVPGGVAGVPPEELARRFPHHRVQVEPDPARALDLLVRGKGNNVGVCCGSFYLVGTLLQLLARREERKS